MRTQAAYLRHRHLQLTPHANVRRVQDGMRANVQILLHQLALRNNHGVHVLAAHTFEVLSERLAQRRTRLLRVLLPVRTCHLGDASQDAGCEGLRRLRSQQDRGVGKVERFRLRFLRANRAREGKDGVLASERFKKGRESFLHKPIPPCRIPLT